jgi:hypothetical protein
MMNSWAEIGSPTAAATALKPAPSTVPRLNPAWKRGITVRPRRRSTSAPSTFIETSHALLPAPTSSRPKPASHTVPVAVPRPSPISPSTIDELPSNTARAGPTRWTNGPASGIVAIAAADRQSSSSPKPAEDRPSSSRTAGARASQPAYATPLAAKLTPTATLAASSRGRSRVVVTDPT